MKTTHAKFLRYLVVIAAVVMAFCGIQTDARADQIPAGWQASNLKPIGYSNLEGRGGAFKIAIRQLNGRWYLYLGHLWNHGWTIVDVTDPASPKVAKFIPGPDNTWTIQMELHDDLMLTALQKSSAEWGNDPNKPNDEGCSSGTSATQ